MDTPTITGSVRSLQEADVEALAELATENAQYLKIQSPLLLTSTQLLQDCFQCSPPKFYSLVYELDNALIGYVLYNLAYSTWEGRTIFLQEFYVKPEYRAEKQHYLLKKFVEKANSMGCKRIAWVAQHDHEEFNSFFAEHGSKHMTKLENWHQYRLDSEKFPFVIGEWWTNGCCIRMKKSWFWPMIELLYNILSVKPADWMWWTERMNEG